MTDEELDVLVRDHYARMEPPERLVRRPLPARRGVEGWMVGLAAAAVLALAAWPILGAGRDAPDAAHLAGAVPAEAPRSLPSIADRVPPGHRAVRVNAHMIEGWPRVGDVAELYRLDETGLLAPSGVRGEILITDADGGRLTLETPTEPLAALVAEDGPLSLAVAVVRSTALREVLLPWPEDLRPLPRGVYVTLGPDGRPVDAADPGAADQVRARILDHPRPDRVLVEVTAADAPRALRLLRH